MDADRAATAALAGEGAPRPVADRLCLQDILYVLHNDTEQNGRDGDDEPERTERRRVRR